MPVRFVIGRAGTGKTVHCLNGMRDALRALPLEGPRLVLLVPEQVSLHMERSLLEGLTAAAAHRAEVLSFRRLAHRILSAYGDGGRTAISPTARSMLLRLLLARHRDALRYYQRGERFAGFVEHLGRTITEFIAEAVSPDCLDLPSDERDPARALKLHDLQLIYAAYLDALGPHRLDPSQHLDVARARLADCGWADGAHIRVDGFAGFSRQERLTLVELAAHAEQMEITLLIDRVDPPGPECPDLFARTRRTMADLSDAFARCGVVVEPPLLLDRAPPRFAGSPVLAAVERRLFRDDAPDPPATCDGVQLIRAADRRTEVDWAAAEILRLVRRGESPLRFRDIAVIVRNLEAYHAPLAAAFRARGIPFFLDRRRSIAHHPLVELLRGMVALGADDYSVDAVRSVLKTGLVGLDDDAADELENHLVATAVAGRERWTARDWTPPPRDRSAGTAYGNARIGRVNRARRRFVDLLDPWVAAARVTEAATGTEWCVRIRAALDRLDVAERIAGWAVDAERDGELDQGEAHRQTWRDVSALLDDLETTFGDAAISLNELADVLESALGQLTLGLAPPMLDQVLVGTIERSRQPDLKAALVLGVNDGAFPAQPAEDPLLNDDDRDWLEQHGLRLGTPRRERVCDESMLFYIAVTRAGERLSVCYSAADEVGRELRPSPFLADLAAACGGLSARQIGDPYRDRADWSILTADDLAAQLAHEFRHRPEVPEDDTARRARWNSLYDLSRGDEELQPALRRALRSLTYRNVASLSKAVADADAADPLEVSVSQLETYAACPFKHFAHYRLGLKERPQSSLAVTDVGTIHHAILERFIVSLVERRQSLAEIDEHDLLAGLDDSRRQVSESVPQASELFHARDRYLAARGGRDLVRVLRDQQRVAQAGKFRPVRAEQAFGIAGGLPALTVKTRGGRTVKLRGFIDRVDLAELSDELLGVVVDYKDTRDKRLDLSRVYHGLSLQLLGYLLVLAQRGGTLAGRPIKPAGAFFVSLADRYESVKHPDDVSDDPKSAHRPRGLIGETYADVFEPVPSGWSTRYSFFRKTDGTIGRIDKTDVAPADSLDRLLAHTGEKLAEWADRILDGHIEVAPYRLKSFSPCSWCDYRGVCRFEPENAETRYLESMKRSEVFRRLASGRSEADHG